MTNAEVITGLRECATVGDCSKCKMHDEYSYDMCAIKLLLAAADALEAADKMIDAQEKEIERLNKELEIWAARSFEGKIAGMALKNMNLKMRIAELEEQISERDAANVIILPCNIGDKIYYCRFDRDGDGWITPMIVCGIHVTKFRTKEKDGEQYLVCELPWFSRSVHVPLKELGKTLFLTEEEAKRCISNA